MFWMQFCRIFWKEWRVHRGLWISCFAMSVAILLLSAYALRGQYAGIMVAMPWVQIFAWMYALGCGGLLFAGEREERTADWLHRLPVNPRSLLAAKLSFAVASTLAIHWLLAFVATLLVLGTADLSAYHLRLLYLPGGLAVLLWSILGSLCSRRVLISIPAIGCWMLATIMLPFVLTQSIVRSLQQAGFVIPVFESELLGPVTAGEYWADVVVIAFMIAVSIFDLWLAWRWCHEKYLDGSAVVRLYVRLMERLKPFIPSRTTAVNSLPAIEHEDSWRRTWQRLIWQERRRESAHRVILIAGCVMAVILVLSNATEAAFVTGQRFRLDFAILCGTLYLSLIPVTMGILGFRCDADHQQPRFLVNRGVSPATLWLAKQAVWLSRAFWIPAVILCTAAISTAFIGQLLNFLNFTFQAVFAIAPPLHGDPLRAIWHGISGLVEFVLLGYCCGQLAAILFQRTVVAFAAAICLNLLALFLQLTIAHFDIPAWWAVGIPIASLLAITLWQARAWMLEDQSWRRWRRLSVAVASILLFLGVALPSYRVAEAMIPYAQPLPAFYVTHSDWKSRRTPEEQAVLQQLNEVARSGWDESSEQADEVVRLMQAPLNSLSGPNLDQARLTRLHDRLRQRSDILLKYDHRHESWECLMTSLKIARCVARDGSFASWLMGIDEQQKTLEQIVLWIGRHELDLTEIDQKRQAVTDELQRFPSISESVVSNYREDRAFMVESDQLVESVAEYGRRARTSPRDGIDLLAIKLPSERKRLDLVLLKLAQISFYSATSLETQGIYENTFYLPLPGLMDSIVQTTPLIGHAGWLPDQVAVMYARRLTVVRAALTRMGLISYRKTHGRLPERLMELADLVAPAALIDPNSNHYFEYYPAFLVSQSPQRIEIRPLSATEMELKQVGRYPAKSIQIGRDQLLSQDPAQIQAIQKSVNELGYVFLIPIEAPNPQ